MLAPDFYPFWGGVGVNIVDIVKRLPKEFNIHVVTIKRGNYDERELCEKLGFKDNVEIHFIGSAKDTFLYNASFQLKCFRYIRQLMRKHYVHIIQSHMAHIPDILLRFTIDLPIVTYIHSTIRWQLNGIVKRLKPNEMEASEAWTLFLYPILEVVHTGYFLRKRNSYYITESHFMKEYIEKEYGIKIHKIIPNSVDIEDIQLNVKRKYDFVERFENKNIVLYAGRLVSYKGVGTLIEAIPRILQKSNDRRSILFVFAGPGNIHGYYKRLRKLNVSDENFVFLGPLSRDKLLKLMSISKCVVVPSYIDNIPNVVLESMACKTPIVASRVGGIPEAIIHGWNGFLVTPGNSKEIAKYVEMLLEDSNLANKMGRRGFDIVKSKFHWDVNISKYVDLYKSIVS
jgi:glycosyltransferase involved in cell wall biosynthesis